MWTLRLSKQASEFFENLTGKHRHQVANGLDQIALDPRQGKALRGDLKGYWSYRVGIYRILYVIRDREIIVEVLRIQHRKEVYEKFRG